MPRNGSGTYSLPSGNPVVTGTTISSTVQNNTTSDIATALTQSLAYDGQTVPVANIPMGGFKLTGLGLATATTDAASLANIQANTGVYVATVGGTADVITLTPSPALSAYVAGNRFSFIASGTNTTNVTVAVSGLAAKAITKNGATALVAGDIPSGALINIIYDGTQFQITSSSGSSNPFSDATALVKNAADATKKIIISAASITTGTTRTATMPDKDITYAGLTDLVQIQPISASVSANALTISASALRLDFRSATLTSGTVTTVPGTPASIVVPSGATLGTINAVQSRLAVIVLNNAGTLELAVVNEAGGTNLDETGVISTTALSAGSTSASVVYSTTSRSSLAYRVIGYIESTQTTAGTWATAPSTIQGEGGQAMAAWSSFGYGQTWQTVTRTAGTTYYNTTGRPIALSLLISGGNAGVTITVNGLVMAQEFITATQLITLFATIPPQNSYLVTNSGTATYTAQEQR